VVEKVVGNCWQCGGPLEAGEFGRETNCRGCGRPTRVCRNCRWFSPGAPGQCREPMAEPVLDKVRANYCEFFEPSAEAAAKAPGNPPDDQLKQAEDLFKF
jgi:hypothetical protein